MTVARDTIRRGGLHAVADEPTSEAAAAAQARSAEIQRQLNLTASEKKHFELVCEVKPDWNDSEIVAFLSKCNYNSNTINDALMNAFEDLRPSEDQSAADWNVQSKKSKRGKKEKAPTPGEPNIDRQRSGPRDRPERFEPRGRTGPHEQRDWADKPERRERSQRRERPNFERRPKWDAVKSEGASAPKPQQQQQANWASSSGSWGEAQSTLPADAGAWGDPAQSQSEAEPAAATTESAPLPVETTPITSVQDNAVPSEGSVATPAAVEPKRSPTTSTISWAGITKRGLTKPTTAPAETPTAVVPEPEAQPTASSGGWGAEEIVGQWGAPEPALPEDAAATVAAAPEAPVSEPVAEPAPTEPESVPAVTDVTETPAPTSSEVTPSPTGTSLGVSAEDLLAASDPVILPQFVSQQVAALNAATIQFGTFSIADDSELVSPNAECVRIHSAHVDLVHQHQHHLILQQQQQQQPEHDIAVEDVSATLRGRHDYVSETAMPMHQFYPPFLNNVHSYMPYDADTPAAYFEPYNQQPQPQQQQQQQQPQRVQRPRQASYNNARNNKMRRDHRNAANNQRQLQPDDFPAGTLGAADPSHSSFGQGPDRDPQGAKQAGMEASARPNTGSRGNKQRQSDRSRGGISGPYNHPSYAGGHIPVGYGQPYGYPAPYLPQFYGQNQQGYGPPGFRQHYSQYQNTTSYQQPYQPRSAYMGQSDYVEPAGMHQGGAFGQHQGEPGPVSKSSEAEHAPHDSAVLYPFEHQAWPDQHRYMLQQHQQHQQHQQQAQSNEADVAEATPEGGPLPQQHSFDRRGDGSPSHQASFGYGGQQYSQAQNYPNFSNQHQYSDSSNRSYPHWASHQ